MISRANKRNLTYKLGINQFSDWTPTEMKMSLGVIPRPEGLKATVPFPYGKNDLKKELDKLPEEYDMRVEGLISPVKSKFSSYIHLLTLSDPRYHFNVLIFILNSSLIITYNITTTCIPSSYNMD